MTRPKHLHAVILDFDGVIANSEPLHLRSFQAVLSEDGIHLDAEDYYARYLGYDDVGMFQRFGIDRGLGWNDRDLTQLVARKGAKMEELLRAGAVLFPGAAEFIRQTAAVVPVGIASGAMRHEILEIVRGAGVADFFSAIVASGDTRESKPSPEPYRTAFLQLRERSGRDLDPRRTVAVEDSRWGLASAHGAGLRCVGVTTSYPAEELPGAELTVSGIGDLELDALDALCARPHA